MCRRCPGAPVDCGVPAAAKWLAGEGAGAAGSINGQWVPRNGRVEEKLANFGNQGGRVSKSPETKAEGQVCPQGSKLWSKKSVGPRARVSGNRMGLGEEDQQSLGRGRN